MTEYQQGDILPAVNGGTSRTASGHLPVYDTTCSLVIGPRETISKTILLGVWTKKKKKTRRKIVSTRERPVPTVVGRLSLVVKSHWRSMVSSVRTIGQK